MHISVFQQRRFLLFEVHEMQWHVTHLQLSIFSSNENLGFPPLVLELLAKASRNGQHWHVHLFEHVHSPAVTTLATGLF